jgi:hypothetical protein
LVVENGRLGLGGDENSPTLTPGGTASVPPNGSAQTRAESGTSVLLFGIVPPDQEWLALSPQPTAGAVREVVPDFLSGTVVMTTEDRVRLRAGPSLQSDTIAELPRGSELTVLGLPVLDPSADFHWYRARDIDGRIGYVAEQFLSELSK